MFNKEIFACTSCVLVELAGKPTTPCFSNWSHPGFCDLMVISDKPSAEESLLMSGYADRHNKFLIKLLNEYFPFKNIYYTYLTKCYSAEVLNKIKSCVDICYKKWLYREINELQPKIILVLGEQTYNYLLQPKIPGLKKHKKFIDKLGEFIQYDMTKFVTWHSSYTLFTRGAAETNKFKKLLERIKEKLNVAI